MKLLFTQDALVNAGAERSHLEILSRFSADTEVGFVYFYPKHDLKKDYERAGIRLFFLDIPESYHFPKAVYRLVRLIRREKPDLLISSLWRADMITRMASWITGVPLIGTLVNDSYSPMAWKDKKGFKYKVVYWLDHWTAHIPIHWIANAQALANSHVKTLGLNNDKIAVIYRGRSVPSNHWTGGGEIKNFVSYGRLLERKGFQDAIRAFAQVIQTHPNCSLTIFGEGPYRTQLESLIQNLGLIDSVFLPGKIPDPHCLLQLPTVDCFLFPSWYEGFSGSLVEAMMAGIPIIASDIPMNLEAIVHGESALVFKVGNASDLTEKMSWAIENKVKMHELGNFARMTAEKRFDIAVIANQYEAALLKIKKSL